jgi:anaerobic selenocysteine-containing dehydrogenase
MASEAEAKVTTDHDEIQQWVEERGGQPTRVKGTESKNSPGLLRIDYPGFSGEDTLEPITWEEFFEAFEKNGLAFLYQEETKDGKESRFSKLVDRSAINEKAKSARN